MIGFFVLVLVVVLVLDLWRRDAFTFVRESAMFKDQDRNRGRGRGRFRRLIEHADTLVTLRFARNDQRSFRRGGAGHEEGSSSDERDFVNSRKRKLQLLQGCTQMRFLGLHPRLLSFGAFQGVRCAECSKIKTEIEDDGRATRTRTI